MVKVYFREEGDGKNPDFKEGDLEVWFKNGDYNGNYIFLGDNSDQDKGPNFGGEVCYEMSGDSRCWENTGEYLKIIKDTKISRAFYKNRIFAECEDGLLAVEL